MKPVPFNALDFVLGALLGTVLTLAFWWWVGG